METPRPGPPARWESSRLAWPFRPDGDDRAFPGDDRNRCRSLLAPDRSEQPQQGSTILMMLRLRDKRRTLSDVKKMTSDKHV
ncbi:MAG: hypothetical protein ABS79_01420 [Planctomycetes bacterium SCN 63-9]|nr:MAG: hypothetical protein ABS79_01420 [Planctomycetes bacterium SCN 63-9]